MKKYRVLSLLLLLLLVACHPEEEEWADAQITEVNVEPNVTSARFTAKVDFQGDKEMALELGEKQDLSHARRYMMNRVDEYHFAIDVNDLNRATTYYFRIQVKNSFLSLSSEIALFKTLSEKPVVETGSIGEVSIHSAVIRGEVTDDGGSDVTERGFCWGMIENPTIGNSHVVCGSGLGAFSAQLSNLKAGMPYNVKAYAINCQDTVYGETVSFITLTPSSPDGAAGGIFSVSSTQSVWFSKGNLQYKASTNTWRFAENTWDYVGSTGEVYEGIQGGTVNGSSNNMISSTYSGWIDLFGWGTSGYNHGAVCYQPWSIDQVYYYYEAYGNSSNNLNDQTGMADWGYNPISNGGNTENTWRTPTIEEWDYLFNTRNTISGIRYAKAKVNGVNGVILLPDNWQSGFYSLNNTNTTNSSYYNNVINQSTWTNSLEAKGAVFFPAAGDRCGQELIRYVGSIGYYWSATHKCDLVFSDSGVSYSPYAASVGWSGESVRLIQNL